MKEQFLIVISKESICCVCFIKKIYMYTFIQKTYRYFTEK